MFNRKAVKSGIAALAAIATLMGVSACASRKQANNSASVKNADSILFAGDTASPAFTRNYNPFSPTKRTGINFIYEPLAVVNSITGEATPFLAEKVKLVDSKTIEYDVRDNVTWQDGKPLTAQDVVFTFNLMKSDVSLDSLGIWQHISSVEAKDDVVTVHLKEADVPAEKIIDQQVIVPEHIWKDVKDPAKWMNEKPVGSGPYKLGNFTTTQYTLVKNDSYWQANKVAAKSIIFPGTNKQLDLATKGYDWAYAYMSDVDKTWVGNHQHNHYWFPPGGTVALYFNLTKKPFDDVNFRKAISYAVDREKIAQDAEEGYVEGASQIGLLMPNQKEWLNPNIPDEGKVKQDTSKALEYFEKAGYTQKDGKLVGADGQQLTLSITVPNGYTDWLRGVQVLQSELNKLGAEVKLVQPQPAAFTQAQNNGNFDLMVSSFGGTGSVFSDFNNLMNSEFALPIGTSTSANFERYKNPEADKLLAQLKRAVNVDEQKKIAHQLQQIMYDDVPVASLFYGGLWGLYSDKKFTGWPTEQNPYAPPTTWTQAVLLVVTHLKKA